MVAAGTHSQATAAANKTVVREVVTVDTFTAASSVVKVVAKAFTWATSWPRPVQGF